MSRLVLFLSALILGPSCSVLGPDLALGGRVTTSSTHTGAVGESGAGAVIDGDLHTRWSSTYADNQWVIIDLKASVPIGLVRLAWETASAREYRVLLSEDGMTWNPAAGRLGMAPGPRVDDLTVSGTGRFVKIALDHRATKWGFSLYEVMVFAGHR